MECKKVVLFPVLPFWSHDRFFRFRWVALQLDSLSDCRSMSTLRQTLSSLPATLDETYALILQRITKTER
jgi:hypothetical protein